MKYQIEYCPNPDCLQIHVDQRLIRGNILSFGLFDVGTYSKEQFRKEALNEEALISFCRAVSELDGMEEDISFNRYDIQLMKASMFSWDDLIHPILDALRTFVARDRKLEEKAPPKKPTEEYLEALRKQGCDV